MLLGTQHFTTVDTCANSPSRAVVPDSYASAGVGSKEVRAAAKDVVSMMRLVDVEEGTLWVAASARGG